MGFKTVWLPTFFKICFVFHIKNQTVFWSILWKSMGLKTVWLLIFFKISSFVFHIKYQTVFLVHTIEVNGTQNCSVTNIQIKSNQIKSLLLSHHHSTCALMSEILQNIFICVLHNKEPNQIFSPTSIVFYSYYESQWDPKLFGYQYSSKYLLL